MNAVVSKVLKVQVKRAKFLPKQFLGNGRTSSFKLHSCSKKGLTLYGSKVHNSSLAALLFPMATTSSMKYCLKQKLHGTTNFSPAGAYLITEQSYSCNFLFCVVSPFKKTCYYAICDYFHQASQKSWAEKLRI